MATNTKEVVTVSRGNSPEIEVPAEINEKAQHFIDNYVAFLKERTEAYVHRTAEAKPEYGGPVLAGDYQYWNCLTVGPIQFLADPPYRPSKIIAAGEATLMLGVVWINPANGPGGSLPGTVVLGGRNYRVRFETINLSDVTNEPWWGRAGAFDNPAQQIYVFPWWRTWPDPGSNPNLYETTFTADIVETGQPMAAFSTWHYNPDVEPGFLVELPPLPTPPPGMVPPGAVPPPIPPVIAMPTIWWPLWYGLPARFLVYKKD